MTKKSDSKDNESTDEQSATDSNSQNAQKPPDPAKDVPFLIEIDEAEENY